MSELLYINGTGTNYYGQTRLCHSFIPDDDWMVASIWIDKIWGQDTTGKLSIYNDNSGEPGTELYTAGDETIVTSFPGAEATWTFSPNVLLSVGIKYWLVWRCAVSSNQIFGMRTDTNIYLNGDIGYSADEGATWGIHVNTYDLRQLKINGEIPIPIKFENILMRNIIIR